MYELRIGLLVLHIASAALLFGGALGLPRLVRNALSLGAAAFRVAAKEAQRRGTLTGIASLMTLWTGVALIFMLGGFARAPINFHIALTLMLVAIACNLVFIRPSLSKLVREGENPEPSATVVALALKKISMGQGILHLIWITNLVLMFHRIYAKSA
jgi:uncharacterized membrane protein